MVPWRVGVPGHFTIEGTGVGAGVGLGVVVAVGVAVGLEGADGLDDADGASVALGLWLTMATGDASLGLGAGAQAANRLAARATANRVARR